MGDEQNMIDTFKKGKYKKIKILNNNSNKVQGGTGNQCDISFKYGLYSYFLEAKHFNNENSSNYPKEMFGEMLMNKYNHIKSYFKSSFYRFSLFLDFNSTKGTCKLLSFCKKHIRKVDWIFFGKLCRSKYIFLFDENTGGCFMSCGIKHLIQNLIKQKLN